MTTTRLIGHNAVTRTLQDAARTAVPADAIVLAYTCPDLHVTTVTLWAEAPIPDTWRCRVCSRFAALPGVENVETGMWRPSHVPYWEPKSHLEQLHERRTDAELQALLDERLAWLHNRRRSRARAR